MTLWAGVVLLLPALLHSHSVSASDSSGRKADTLRSIEEASATKSRQADTIGEHVDAREASDQLAAAAHSRRAESLREAADSLKTAALQAVKPHAKEGSELMRREALSPTSNIPASFVSRASETSAVSSSVSAISAASATSSMAASSESKSGTEGKSGVDSTSGTAHTPNTYETIRSLAKQFDRPLGRWEFVKDDAIHHSQNGAREIYVKYPTHHQNPVAPIPAGHWSFGSGHGDPNHFDIDDDLEGGHAKNGIPHFTPVYRQNKVEHGHWQWSKNENVEDYVRPLREGPGWPNGHLEDEWRDGHAYPVFHFSKPNNGMQQKMGLPTATQAAEWNSEAQNEANTQHDHWEVVEQEQEAANAAHRAYEHKQELHGEQLEATLEHEQEDWAHAQAHEGGGPHGGPLAKPNFEHYHDDLKQQLNGFNSPTVGYHQGYSHGFQAGRKVGVKEGAGAGSGNVVSVEAPGYKTPGGGAGGRGGGGGVSAAHHYFPPTVDDWHKEYTTPDKHTGAYSWVKTTVPHDQDPNYVPPAQWTKVGDPSDPSVYHNTYNPTEMYGRQTAPQGTVSERAPIDYDTADESHNAGAGNHHQA